MKTLEKSQVKSVFTTVDDGLGPSTIKVTSKLIKISKI